KRRVGACVATCAWPQRDQRTDGRRRTSCGHPIFLVRMTIFNASSGYGEQVTHGYRERPRWPRVGHRRWNQPARRLLGDSAADPTPEDRHASIESKPNPLHHGRAFSFLALVHLLFWG